MPVFATGGRTGAGAAGAALSFGVHAIGRSDAGRSDEQIRALATRDGVMGITTVNFFVSKKPRSAVGGNFMRVYGEILG